MTPTDHYAEAERLLDEMDYRNAHENLAAAQVHATLAFVQWQRRTDVKHTNKSALRDEQAARGVRTIPWPPSDGLVARVTAHVRDVLTSGDPYRDVAYAATRAVLDAIGGEA